MTKETKWQQIENDKEQNHDKKRQNMLTNDHDNDKKKCEKWQNNTKTWQKNVMTIRSQ